MCFLTRRRCSSLNSTGSLRPFPFAARLLAAPARATRIEPPRDERRSAQCSCSGRESRSAIPWAWQPAPGGLFASAVRCALAPSPSYQAQCGAGSAPHEVVVEGSHFTFLQQPALAASAAAHIASFLNSIAARDDLPSGGADGGPAPIVDGQASLGHGACAAACA